MDNILQNLVLMANGAVTEIGTKALGFGQNGDFSRELLVNGEALQSQLEALGVDPESISPEVLALLQQWLSGGEALPQAASSGQSLPDDLPQELINAQPGNEALPQASATDANGTAVAAATVPQSAVADEVVLPESELATEQQPVTNEHLASQHNPAEPEVAAQQAAIATPAIAEDLPETLSAFVELARRQLFGQSSQTPVSPSAATPSAGVVPGQQQAQQAAQGLAATATASALTEEPVAALPTEDIDAELAEMLQNTKSLLKVTAPSGAQFEVMKELGGERLHWSATLANGISFSSGTAPATMGQALSQSLTSMQIPQAVGQDGWSAAMGERLIWMVKGDQQTAKINLTPPNLGPLEIKLTINDDQASVAFVSNHAQVRDAIEQAIPRLREMLEQQSLNLVDVDVGSAKQEQGSSTQDGDGQLAGQGATEAEGEEGAQLAAPVSQGEGLVDLFA